MPQKLWKPPEVTLSVKDNGEDGLEVNITAKKCYPKSYQNGKRLVVMDVVQRLQHCHLDYFGYSTPMRLILKMYAKPRARIKRLVARNISREKYLNGNPSFIV